MSAPLGPKFDQVMKSPAVQELLKQRPDVPSEKPEVQKTVEELEEERRALEVACKTFAGADGKGGTIAELTDIVQAEEQEEAELIELLGANADLEAELAPAREARAEDRKQIESLKRAYDTLLEEIAALNKQIREARDAQVKEGKEEVEKEGEKIEDLTEHAVMEPPPVPFKAREASMRVEERRQAALAEAPDLTEHAVLQPPSIPEAVREASMKRYAERQAAQASPGVNASNETSFATAEATTTPIKETPPVDAPKTTPEKPEPAAKNEKGPENIAQAQALIAEQQREQMEVRQRLLALYKTYKEELLPQTQGVYEVAQALGGLGAVTTPGAEKAGPFASLQLGAKMQLDDARSLQGLFTGLQAEAMKNTPKDIEAATRDVQLVTARLQMRMQGLQGYRNTILGLRTALPRGSAREQALLALDAAAGKAWKAAGKMQAEWQPIGSKIQARNGREHHKLYEQAYGLIVDARAKGQDVVLQVPEDVLKNMPTEVLPANEDLSKLQTQEVSFDVAAITKEMAEAPAPKPENTSSDSVPPSTKKVESGSGSQVETNEKIYDVIDQDPLYEEVSKVMGEELLQEEKRSLMKSGRSEEQAVSHMLNFGNAMRGADGVLRPRYGYMPWKIHQEFAKRYPEKYQKYAVSEQARIYRNMPPEYDPAYAQADRKIHEAERRIVPFEDGVPVYFPGVKEQFEEEKAKILDGFVREFPEKAAAYGESRPDIKAAVARQKSFNRRASEPLPRMSI